MHNQYEPTLEVFEIVADFTGGYKICICFLLIQETDVEKAFREGKYQWIPYGKVGFRGGDLFGHWFERILITFLLLSWAYISWNFTGIPSIIRALGVIAPIVWITYAFQRFSPDGDIMMPDLSER